MYRCVYIAVVVDVAVFAYYYFHLLLFQLYEGLLIVSNIRGAGAPPSDVRDACFAVRSFAIERDPR